MSGGDDGSGFAALEASRADRAPDGRQDASGLAQQLAAYATEQFMAGLVSDGLR